MPGSPRISGEAFAIERLRENPDLDYASVRRMAEEAGVAMQPILYGRARRHLDLPPMRPNQTSGPRAIVMGTPPQPNGAARPDASNDMGNEDGEALDDDEQNTGRGDESAAGDAGRAPEHSANDSADGDDSDADTDSGADADAADADADEAGAGAQDEARKNGSPAFEFLLAELKRDPTLAYGVLRDRAATKGFPPIAPIMYGRAKALLGLVPVKPRGSKKASTTAAPAPAAPRLLKQVDSVAADRFAQKLEEVRSLDQLISAVKELDAERRRLRALLERIVDMIDEVLG